MSVYCNEYAWEQEDFFDESFNPARFLSREFDEVLFGSKTDELKKTFYTGEFVSGNPIHPNAKAVSGQENIARWYEYFGRRIREMKWTTIEQFYDDPDKTCPKCGSRDLSTD